MDDFDSLRQRIRNAPIGEPPEPWTAMATFSIPGMTEVGFAEDSQTLLVISSHGRELIDCRSGRRVARDSGVEHQSAWVGSHDLIGNGFAALSGRQIRLAGIAGGGLSALTRDGWGAVRLPLDWPQEYLILTSPFSSIYNADAPFWKIAVTTEPIAWGFSNDGRSLVAVTADELRVYHRSGTGSGENPKS